MVMAVPWQNVTGAMIPFRVDASWPSTPKGGDRAICEANQVVFVEHAVEVIVRGDHVSFLQLAVNDVEDMSWCYTPFPTTGRVMFQQCSAMDQLLSDDDGSLRADLEVRSGDPWILFPTPLTHTYLPALRAHCLLSRSYDRFCDVPRMRFQDSPRRMKRKCMHHHRPRSAWKRRRANQSHQPPQRRAAVGSFPPQSCHARDYHPSEWTTE